MELFGIGPLELIFILLIALIVLGPRDMVKAGNTLGRFMRRTILSPTWMKIQREIRNLPYQMMREAGLEEEDLRININTREGDSWKPESTTISSNKNEFMQSAPLDENSIGRIPEIPNEWLGLPNSEQEPYIENPSSDEQNPLAEWISHPEIGTETGNPSVPVAPDTDLKDKDSK
jgi:Sec-independent protein translocase protein TatA